MTALRSLAAIAALLLAPACRPAPPPAGDVAQVIANGARWDGAGDATLWSWTGGTDRTDWITRVIETRDRSVVAVGFVNRTDPGGGGDWDAVAMRFTAEGRLLWSRRIGGAGLDAFWDVKEDARGRLVIAGFSSTASAGENDAWLVVLDRDGRQLFERRYGGAAEDRALGVALAADDGLVLVGETRSAGAGERDVLLVRTDADGVETWRRTYGGAEVDRGFFVAAVEGGYAIAGVTGPEGRYDILAMKVSERGDVVWRHAVGGEGNDPNHGMNVLPDGRIVVVGYAQSWDSAVHDVVALTFAPDGTLLRHELLGGPGDDRVMSSATDAEGGTWLFGYTRSFGAGEWDVMAARLRPDGSFEPWMAALGTAHQDQAYGASVASDGDLLVGGFTTAPSAGAAPADLLVARLAPSRIARRTEGVTVRRIR